MIEVAVEDITQTIIHGNDTQEALRPLPDRGYPNRREIRQTLLHDGAHRIDDMTYLRAVSSPGMDSIDSQQLWDQLDLSWGVRNTLGFVSRRLIAYETAYLKDAEGTGMTPAEALAHAAFEVNRELTEEPDKVFWPGYQKPQPHMGAAALVGAGQS
jgi:hypothetical protein